MEIYIIAAGKIKSTNSLSNIITEYTKRLTTIKLNIIDFDDKNLSQEEINNKIFILAHQKKNSTKILLDEKGLQTTSYELTNLLSKIETKSICFLIAGSEGFLNSYKTQANIIYSLSKLTLPHLLARLFLVEQIYRVQTIIQKHPYHKE